MAFKSMKKNIAWVKAKREAEGITATKRERKLKRYATLHPTRFLDKMLKFAKQIPEWFKPPVPPTAGATA
jgi:hypothetical protein